MPVGYLKWQRMTTRLFVATAALPTLPARTPPAVITRIHDETVKVLHMPDVRERIISVVGYEPTGTTPAQLAEFLRTETAMWAKVI